MSNVFSFTGACGNDAEVRYLPSGQAVLNVRVANNIGYGDKQQTLWINCVIWGKRAEGSLKDYLKKGQQVFVSGELTQREYKANDGTMRTSLEVNATILDLVGKRTDTGSSAMPSPKTAPSANQNNANYDNFDAPYDDDIPF